LGQDYRCPFYFVAELDGDERGYVLGKVAEIKRQR